MDIPAGFLRCINCNRLFKTRGFPRHLLACQEKWYRKIHDQALRKLNAREASRKRDISVTPDNVKDGTMACADTAEPFSPAQFQPHAVPHDASLRGDPVPMAGASHGDPSIPDNDGTHSENHPHIDPPPRTELLDTFELGYTSAVIPDVEGGPFTSVMTREEFEFAEFVLDAGMTEAQIDRLVKLIHRIMQTRLFTLRDGDDVKRVIDQMSTSVSMYRQVRK